MFNKTLVPYEKTVIEKRAPTDDSIRIYDEMREKALNSIIESIQVNDNIFNLKAVLYRDRSRNMYVVKYQATINGRKISGEVDEDDFELAKDWRQSLEKVSQDIAGKITRDVFEVLLCEFSPKPKAWY